VNRTSLARVNEAQPYTLYEGLFHKLLSRCQQHAPRHGFRFKNKLYSLDSSTIDLCLSVFPWAKFRCTKGAVKLHVGLDRAYIDYAWFNALNDKGTFFVTRQKRNATYHVIERREVLKNKGVTSDHGILISGTKAKDCPIPLRRIDCRDPNSGERFCRYFGEIPPSVSACLLNNNCDSCENLWDSNDTN